MIERWEVRPAPSSEDPRRHVLRLKADMPDIHRIIRHLGAFCGRPQKERGSSAYNFSLHLLGATEEVLSRTERFLFELSPSGRVGGDGSGGAAHGTVTGRERLTEPPREEMRPSPPAMECRLQGSLESGPPPRSVGTRLTEPSREGMPGRAAGGHCVQGPSGDGPPPEAVEEGLGEIVDLISLVPEASDEPRTTGTTREEAPAPPAQHPPLKPVPQTLPPRRLEPAPPPRALRAGAEPPIGAFPVQPPLPAGSGPVVPKTTPPEAVGKKPVAEVQREASGKRRQAGQILWGVQVLPGSSCTFETLSVGAFNRFAHAASMAVVSNPGTMYNPLFLYGVPGVGKTHLLQAIGRSIQESSRGEPVFFTTGPRLSRAVRLAAAAGKLADLEAFADNTKALMLDDVHLLAVSEQNQAGLCSILSRYFGSSKHVAMTSVYPPRSLGSLEEALKFQISSGWSVEMKLPNVETQKKLMGALLARQALASNEEEASLLYEGVKNNFHETHRWLRRLRHLADVRTRRGEPAGALDLAPLLFPQELPPDPSLSADELRSLLAGRPPLEPGRPPYDGKARGAVFFPKGMLEHARFALDGLSGAVSELGFGLPLSWGLVMEYDPEQLYGVPFMIAEACDRAGVDAAVILGPYPGSGLSVREGELYHALEHLLDSLDIPLGWIPFIRLRQPVSYLRAFLDLFPILEP